MPKVGCPLNLPETRTSRGVVAGAGGEEQQLARPGSVRSDLHGLRDAPVCLKEGNQRTTRRGLELER